MEVPVGVFWFQSTLISPSKTAGKSKFESGECFCPFPPNHPRLPQKVRVDCKMEPPDRHGVQRVIGHVPEHVANQSRSADMTGALQNRTFVGQSAVLGRKVA